MHEIGDGTEIKGERDGFSYFRLKWLHESGTYVKFTQAGADLFA